MANRLNQSFQIVQYQIVGNEKQFNSIVSGLGKNRNTWDYTLCRTSAFKYAKKLRETEDNKSIRYTVEKQFN